MPNVTGRVLRGNFARPFMLAGRIPIGAAGAVGTAVGSRFTAVHTGAGIYTVTFSDNYSAFLALNAALVQAAASALLASRVTRSATGFVLRTYSDPGWVGAIEGRPYTVFAPLATGTDIMPVYGGAHDSDATGLAGVVHPDFPRTVQINAAGAGSFIVNGTNMRGVAIEETIAAGGAGVTAGVRTFRTITRLRGDAGGTWEFGPAFGVMDQAAAFRSLNAAGVYEAFSATDLVNMTWTPTTAPDGARDYTVWYEAQDVGVLTLADPSNGDEIDFIAVLDDLG